MCPLRFILVFFSAVLAGYFAWRTVSSPDEAPAEDSIQSQNMSSTTEKRERFHFFKAIQNGFWVFTDMASGRYLWRNIKQFSSSRDRRS